MNARPNEERYFLIAHKQQQNRHYIDVLAFLVYEQLRSGELELKNRANRN